MFGIEQLKEFITKHEASGSRSSILNPISWLIALFLIAYLIGYVTNFPAWVLVLIIVFVMILFVLYVFTYLFCLFTDKDALRSEKYTLTKLAIQKGIYGDNIQGVIKDEKLSALPMTKGMSREK